MLAKTPKNKKVKLTANDWLRAASAIPQKNAAKLINPFVFPDFPPKATPSNAKMAMDQNVCGVNQWASGAIIETAFTEGLMFLGYPYLSMLAQRPEYRVMVETLAGEMTRKWGKFEAKGEVEKQDRIDQLNEKFEQLQVRDNFRTIAEQDGYFGRAHLYLDFGTDLDARGEDLRAELTKSIGNGDDKMSKAKVNPAFPIRSLRTVEPVWCYPTTYESINPLKAEWYNPQQWYVMGTEIHHSRLLKFVMRPVPDLLKPAYSFGGLSLTQIAKPYVDNWLTTRQSVNDLIQAFVVWQLATNLSEALMMGGDQLFARAEFFNRFRNNRGLILTDKETEEFKNTTAPLSGLEMLQAQAQEHMAAISRIPLVKLLGIQPAGLNASSEGEIRVFYDTILEYQTKFFEKNLKRVIDFTMLSLWGEVDKDISWAWEPLWALDEKQQAEVDEVRARTGQIFTETGIVSQEEERKRIADEPATPYPGLDWQDMPDLPEEQAAGLPQGRAPRVPGARGAGGGGGGAGGAAEGGTEGGEGRQEDGTSPGDPGGPDHGHFTRDDEEVLDTDEEEQAEEGLEIDPGAFAEEYSRAIKTPDKAERIDKLARLLKGVHKPVETDEEPPKPKPPTRQGRVEKLSRLMKGVATDRQPKKIRRLKR